MTREEALEKHATKWWEHATPKEIVEFQLFEDRLCMPWHNFQEATEKVLERPVFTHEFARADDLRNEFKAKVA